MSECEITIGGQIFTGSCSEFSTENESRVRMMCGKLGVPIQMKRVCDTWTDCWIPASTTS